MRGIDRLNRAKTCGMRAVAHCRVPGHLGAVLNIHHLELFYHVARAGGISRAVKRIPYGIQQPAVSGQIAALEREVGVKLFERSPFKLTPAGVDLFDFVEPFFGGLAGMEAKLRERSAPVLRVGAAELALRFHLPAVLQRLRAREPRLRLTLRSGFQAEFEAWLLDRSIDLAVTPLDRRPPRGLRSAPLVRVLLVLQVPKKSRWKSADELWREREVKEPLIALPETESVLRRFRAGLQRRGVRWPTSIEASSLEAITAYVVGGGGIGLNVGLPEVAKSANVRVLPLDGFEPLEIAALWRGAVGPQVEALLDEARAYVSAQWPQWQCVA
jgi:DNA-binding transcriptional LysR family regulator